MNRPEEDWSARRLHFVGIGGAGMSGLAIIARELGASVTGSDRAASSYTERLREHGIEPTLGHRAENVPAGAEVVFSTAVPPDNPERRAAEGRELHRSELLAQIASLRRCLAVTGTHGKTTTAAMVVHILRACGLDPAYVVGGELGDTGVNAGWGSGEWIVVEADESDRSLLRLWPEIAVLTNAELDHHSTYSSRLDLEETLREFMGRAKLGAVVWDRPRLLALAPGRRARLRRLRHRDVPARIAVSLARDRGIARRSGRAQRPERGGRADRVRSRGGRSGRGCRRSG